MIPVCFLLMDWKGTKSCLEWSTLTLLRKEGNLGHGWKRRLKNYQIGGERSSAKKKKKKRDLGMLKAFVVNCGALHKNCPRGCDSWVRSWRAMMGTVIPAGSFHPAKTPFLRREHLSVSQWAGAQ